LLGNLTAILISSVGPCFYAHIVPGPDPYAGLMQYLSSADRQIPVLALQVQHALWSDHAHGIGSTALSISAMPSMHVGSATLLALFGWRLSRTVGFALTIFAVLIMLGSVHLGWHYAIDGYVAALGAALIWFTTGRLRQLREGD
jgi:membrane-associated phospholipid phosphatase